MTHAQPKRIAIDARKLRDYGIGTYVRNLLRQLARQDPHTEYVLLCRPEDCDVIGDLGPNFRAVRENAGDYSVREQFAVPIDLRREHVDLFHAPHYVLPPLTPCRSVVTIHDCIHLRFPQYLPNRLGYAYARSSLWVATHRAARVITVSEASKRDILRYYRVPEERIDVIYNAIDDRFWLEPPADAMERVRERYQLNAPFVLYAGNIKPHKNLERLIEAFHLLRRDETMETPDGARLRDVKLLIIGDEISKYAALRRAVHRHKLHKHVRFFGFVSDQTLAVLYRLADAFVFPSLYEGFGLPPLEAMASGTPVVTSNVSSLPEVVGDAALLIDPYEPQSIADALRRVLTERSLRADLRARGLARARAFSWERSIRRVREIYDEVMK
ncbi:MAG TPA: glycosyltransferase family 1 protein [Vicinamibacterales bacterium]|nr:glycosyltransferase family 1 protein [Vicinamibacterales bacterium]